MTSDQEQQPAGESDGAGRAGGPLRGLRVVEFAGIGPGPFAAVLLADLGADVLSVRRPGTDGFAAALPGGPDGILDRGRHPLDVDLKDPAGVARVRGLCERADALIEGFRPGTMERLGLGPDALLARNPRLVYGRMTGWGQDGPLAGTAGHDINYIALSGALASFARHRERPVPPVNTVGDFGGGGMLLALGLLAALREAEHSGRGQVVDAAMTDGAAQLMAMVYDLRRSGAWPGPPGTNLLDTGAPFYDTYRTADGRFVAVGALEEPFYAALLDGLGLDPADLPDRADPANWPTLRERFTRIFAGRTRDEWAKQFDGTDACVTPVLTLDEAPRHPHATARASFTDGRPSPSPRFSSTPSAARPLLTAADTESLLRRW